MANTTDCTTSDYIQQAYDQLFNATYRVLAPVYLAVGLCTNSILLFAFYKQSKTDRAYGYQVALTVSKTIEIFFYGFFVIVEHWVIPSGYQWFVGNYGLVRLHNFNLGFVVSFTISSVLFAVAMASDRVFSITAPLYYRSINHVRHQILAFVMCTGLGFLVGGVMFFAKNVDTDGNGYVGVRNMALIQTSYWTVAFTAISAFRIGAVLALMILNPVMIVTFRKRATKSAAICTDKEMLKAERALLWINVYQVFMMIFGQLPHTAWTSFLYLDVEFCGKQFAEPICDGFMMLVDATDFFLVITINKKMRALVWNLKPKGANSVHSLA